MGIYRYVMGIHSYVMVIYTYKLNDVVNWEYKIAYISETVKDIKIMTMLLKSVK